MDNPLMPLALMWQSRRPSKLEDMPAVRNRFWLRKGYSAVTFFGTIITASTEIAKQMGTGTTGDAERMGTDTTGDAKRMGIDTTGDAERMGTDTTGIAERMGTDTTGDAVKGAKARRAVSMSSLKRHEMIHLRQAQSLHDSWLLFYVRYLWYYVGGLSQNRHMRNAAYLINPFEMEAYRHQDEADYLEECRDGANGWRIYARMKASERLEEYRHPTI